MLHKQYKDKFLVSNGWRYHHRDGDVTYWSYPKQRKEVYDKTTAIIIQRSEDAGINLLAEMKMLDTLERLELLVRRT